MQEMSTYVSWLTLVLSLFVLGVSAQQNGTVRLAGPNSNGTHGRVEIFYNNQWGTVCDDQFDFNEAIVVCRQLGHSTSGASVITANVYGPGTGPIWMDDLACEATEPRLADCQFAGWNQSDCSHLEDVGVACISLSSSPLPATTQAPTPVPVVPEAGNCSSPDPNIRLLSPTNRRGNGVVQIFRNGMWGNICDNGWDINDARVVCRMLCYNPADALPGSENLDTSNITEPMVVSNMQCIGNEANISNCPQSAWALDSCGRNEMAMVTCVPIEYRPVRPEPILQCQDGLLTASFNKTRDTYLESKHLTIAYNYSGPCGLVFGNSTTDVSVGIPFDECGTVRTTNATHIMYNNTIKYASTYTSAGGLITFANTYLIEVMCELPRDVIADKPIVPLTETVTQSAEGSFVVSMEFYRDNSFSNPVTQFPLEIPLGEWLNGALVLDNVDSSLLLVVHNCTATPTANREDPIRYPLFRDKCPEDSSVTLFPLTETWYGWRFRTFKFVQFSEVHIHCDALVCGQEETSLVCDRSCFESSGTRASASTTGSPVGGPTTNTSGRKKRSANRAIRSVHISSSTIIVYNPNDPVEIERPETTAAPEIITASPTKISSTNANQTPPTSVSSPQTLPLTTSHASSGDSDGAIENPGIVIVDEINVFSKASVFVFSLFTITQFILCVTLFYMLI